MRELLQQAIEVAETACKSCNQDDSANTCLSRVMYALRSFVKTELAKPEVEAIGFISNASLNNLKNRIGWETTLTVHKAKAFDDDFAIYTHPLKQPLSEDEEMALFEKWASDPVRVDRLPDLRHSNGAYMDSRTYIAWYAWKGKAALVSS